MGRLLTNLGWLLGSRGINAAFSMVYLAATTRSLGVAGFGQFVLIVVMAQLVAGLSSFSTWQGVVRWGLLPGEAGRALGFAVALDLASLAVGGVVALGVVWVAPFWLPLSRELRPTCLLLCLTMLLAARSTPTGVLRLHDRFDLALLAEAVLPAARMAGAIAAALAHPAIGTFVAAWALAEIACAAAHWRLALRLQPLRLADVSLRALPGRHEGAWRFVWGTNLSRSLAVVSKQLMQLLAGASGGPAMAGGYRIAAQLGTALAQFGEVVSRALYPELVRADRGGDSLARRTAVMALGAGVLAVGLAMTFGKAGLVLLVGPQFAFAAPAMTALALAGAFELLAATWDALLVSRGRAGAVFVRRAAPMALALALVPAMTITFGLIGAAWCAVLASGLAAVLLAREAHGPMRARTSAAP